MTAVSVTRVVRFAAADDDLIAGAVVAGDEEGKEEGEEEHDAVPIVPVSDNPKYIFL